MRIIVDSPLKLTIASTDSYNFKVDTNTIESLKVAENENIRLSVDTEEKYRMGVASVINVIDGEYYTGVTEVTPTNETQVLETKELFVSKNIVINPIPSNYGLITWNGSTLTVS